MAKHDFSALMEHYPEVIQMMPDSFTSHRFILALAHKHQRLYIEALHSYRRTAAPFMHVHSVLARRLRGFPERVSQVRPDAPSTDIFEESAECAEWKRLD
jgi:hypothetical protein